MKKNGFTLIELLVCFILITFVSLSLFKTVLSLSQKQIKNISYNEYSRLNGIEQCPDLEFLSMKGTKITDISVLENLHNFNTIYLDNDFDRSQIDFMIGNFKNGDEKTKQYLLDKQYNLND